MNSCSAGAGTSVFDAATAAISAADGFGTLGAACSAAISCADGFGPLCATWSAAVSAPD